jgi:hypothetical protein
MTKHSFSLYQPIARGRSRMLALATAVAIALGALLGTATSRADVGSVYFDADNNAAAGDPNQLFNASFTGLANVGLGPSVMPNLTDGSGNTAVGNGALGTNTSGDNNIAAGDGALAFNTVGNENVANGTSALEENTTGDANVANGSSALGSNTTGNGNVATGFLSLFTNMEGMNNVATGNRALFSNTTGNSNVAIGPEAGSNLTSGSNNVAIANNGVAGESGTIRIGTDGTQTAAFIAGVSGTQIPGKTRVLRINADGQLGTAKQKGGGAALASTVERLQRQVRRLREQVKGG